MFGFLKSLFGGKSSDEERRDKALLDMIHEGKRIPIDDKRKRKPSIAQQFIINQNDAYKRDDKTSRNSSDDGISGIVMGGMILGGGNEPDCGGSDSGSSSGGGGGCDFRPGVKSSALPAELRRGLTPNF